MSDDQEVGRRIARALKALGWKQTQLAKAIGKWPQQLNEVIRGDRPGLELVEKIAEHLQVSALWLRTGDREHAPSWAVEASSAGDRSMSLVGAVTAGSGEIENYIKISDPERIPLPESWKLVRIEGWSAYPVAFPGQLAMVDLERGRGVDELTEDDLVDLHDNIVLVQAEEKDEKTGKTIETGYLKRFCWTPRSPHGFLFASVDSGRGTPYIDPASIRAIFPVVGIIFLDPLQSRAERLVKKRKELKKLIKSQWARE